MTCAGGGGSKRGARYEVGEIVLKGHHHERERGGRIFYFLRGACERDQDLMVVDGSPRPAENSAESSPSQHGQGISTVRDSCVHVRCRPIVFCCVLRLAAVRVSLVSRGAGVKTLKDLSSDEVTGHTPTLLSRSGLWCYKPVVYKQQHQDFQTKFLFFFLFRCRRRAQKSWHFGGGSISRHLPTPSSNALFMERGSTSSPQFQCDANNPSTWHGRRSRPDFRASDPWNVMK